METTEPARHNTLFPNVLAGLIIGFTEIIVAVSLASLVFSGTMNSYLARGIAAMLVTVVVHLVITGLFSSFKNAISSIQDNPVVVLSVSVVALLGSNPLASDELFATVIALILTMTLLTGVFLVLLGTFRLGGLVRYIPYPVIGGFLAGTGWLLAQGGIGSMISFPLNLTTLGNLFAADQLGLWFPGTVFGLLLFFAVQRLNHWAVLPAMLLGGLVLFYVVLLFSGTSIEQAIANGLLLGNLGDRSIWQPLPLGELTQADWGAILAQGGNIAVLVVITAISLLLNVSGLELALREDADLNRELRVAGAGNIISALAGGVVGYHAISFTMLSRRMGARGGMPSIIASGFALLVLFLGASILTYMPKPLLGGLLVLLGLDLLNGWVVQGYRKFDRTEYTVVLLILGVIVVAGFLIGVGVGLVLMVIMFVVNYSRLNIFHNIRSGAEASSHVRRNSHHRRALNSLAKQVHVLELQGFIFFGSANTILEQVRKRLNDPDEKPLKFLVLDFRRVRQLDSSAAFSFTKVKFLADTHDFVLIFTHLLEGDQRQLTRNGLEPGDHLQVFPDLDHALEWCEETLIQRYEVTQVHFPATLSLQLADYGFKKEYTRRLKEYLQVQVLEPGDYLIRQGDKTTELFFIEIGSVSVYLELGHDKRVRLETVTMGTPVGELGYYLNEERAASVIANMKTVAYRLDQEKHEQMKSADPELAIAFNELIARIMAERLISTTRKLAALNQ